MAFIDEQKKLDAIAAAFKEFTGQTVKQGIATKANSNPVTSQSTVQAPTSDFSKQIKQFTAGPTVQLPMPTAQQTIQFQPAQQKNWYRGEMPTASEMLAQITRVGQQNYEQGLQMMDLYNQLQNDKSSPFWAPYSKPTNLALTELAALGFDVSNGVDDKWFQDNAYLMNYYRESSASGGALAPTKKSSWEEKAAYWYNQALKDDENTKKAEQEWAALQEEIAYWTNRSDRNYSDDEILGKINWNNYKTLQKMDEAKDTGSPMMLNRAIGYNKDDLRGIIWAARNGSTGSTMLDSVQYELGKGNGWHENANVRGKLDVTNKETYSPYSVGSTLDDAALYFGVNDFSSDWCEKNRHLLASDNDTDRKMWQKVYEAEQNTKQAEAELAELMGNADSYLSGNKVDPEMVVQWLKDDLDDMTTLKKMDDSRDSAKLIDTTRAVNYRWEDVEAEVRRRAEEKNRLQDSAVTLKKAYDRLQGKESILHDPAAQASKDTAIGNANTIIQKDGTDAEKKVFKQAGSSGFSNYVNRMAEIVRTGMALPQTVYDAEKKQATDYAAQHLFDSRKTIDDYEAAQQQKNDAQQTIDSILEGMPANVGAAANPRFMGVMASAGVSERPMWSNTAMRPETTVNVTPPEEDSDEGKALLMWMAQNRDRVQEINQQADWDDDKAWAMAWQEYQQEQMPDPQESYIESLDPETRAQYYAAQKALEEADATIEKLQGSYDEAQGHMEQIGNRQDIAARMGALGGADMGEDQIEAMNQLYEIGKEYKPTVYSTETIFDALPEKERIPAAKKAVEEYTAELQRIDETMKALDGVQFSEGSSDIFNNVQRERERLQRELTAARDFLLRGKDDFDTTADAEIQKVKDGTTANWLGLRVKGEYNWFDAIMADPSLIAKHAPDEVYIPHMTEEERKTYFYIRATEGKKAASDYYWRLADNTYGVLTNRIAQSDAAEQAEFAKEHPIAANVAAILLSPVKAAGGIYGFATLLTGGDVNPNSPWRAVSNYSATVKGTTKQQINEYYGEGTTGSKIVNLFYDAMISAAESGMNSLTFGGLMPDTGSAIANSFIGAAPMGIAAADDAMTEALDKGATPEQALAKGATVFMLETGTEAITYNNMHEAFYGAGDAAKTAEGFKGFVVDLFKDMGEEATGEMVNEALGYVADDLIMGELSERNERINYYMSVEGGAHSAEDADVLATKDAVGKVLEAGITAVISAGMTTGVSSVAGDISNRTETARISRNNMAILEEAMQADTASQTEAVAATLATDGNVDASTAAAVEMMDSLGGEVSINAMKHIEAIAASSRMNLEEVHSAVRTAATGKGSAFTALRDIAEHGATQQKVQNLVDAAAQDVSQTEVQERMQQTEADIRAAGMVREQAANGAFDSVFAAQEETQKAKAKQRLAEKELNRMQQKAEQLGDAFMTMQDQYMQDPTNIKAEGAMIQAMNDLDGQNEVVHEYEQSLQNQQEATAMAERKYNREREKAMGIARDLAEQQMAADREAAAQEAANQQRIAEERQAAEDERTGKTEDDAAAALADRVVAETGMDSEEADAFRNRVEQRYAQLKAGTADLTQSVNEQEAAKILGRMSRKIGVDIQIAELPVGRGRYENGVITLSNKLTVGQAMVEAALHEVTHALEQTKAYQAYHDFVLNTKYGTAESLQAAIDQKIADYAKSGVELNEDGAKRELVADFARTDLHNRDTVYRLVNNGFGSTIRNALHNVNQYLKNMRLTGQERVEAENLRKAERLFAKALKQKKMTDTHPTEAQFSIPQMAQAMGLSFDENTLQLSDPNTGRIVENVTPDMLNNTPIGKLIDTAASGLNLNGKVKFAPTISQETAAAQKQMFADLMSMCAKYKDSDLVWEIASSTLSSQFSALKSNSDPQYGTTIDFGTVCAKTQEIINVLSQTMLEKGRGLTRDEIMTVYNETYNAGLTVPCPVCYVFSRWMGVPSLLGQMKQYQQNYVVTDANGNVDIAATQEKVDAYVKNAQEKYGDAKAINKANGKLNSSLKRQEDNRVKYLTQLEQIKRGEITEKKPGTIQKKLDDTIQKMVDLDKRIGELSAYNWITQALCNKDENGNYTVDPNFRVVPDEVLFDLNRTGEFARYQKSWKYRSTRGAGMGKAILPYSGETIGDIVSGTTRWAADQNPYLNMDDAGSVNALNNAIAQARKQNLVGGQRLQSTSDFRPEWGLDYMMSFLELQAIGSKAQLYTKVSEAVDLLASVGADVNLSIMGKGQGWHVDENGKYVLDFSDVTGMPYETAKGLKDNYDNVQMILVGMNDTHIRLAMADSDIDFIIPWHSSGNSKDTLAKLIGSVGETLETSSDYTDYQTDTPKKGRTEEQKAKWNARVKMLTGKELTLEERTMIYSDPYLKPLYDRFYVEGVDPDCYGVKLPKSQAEQIFPYEYWVTDPSQPGGTKATADVNGQRFAEYCESFGLVPRFSQFKNDPGYWKLLIDRSMYDLNGNYRAQQVIDVTNAKIGQLQDGHLTNSQLPLETSAKYGSKYSEQERQAVENSIAAIDAKYDVEGSFSIAGDITDADIDQALNDAGWMTESQSDALDSDFSKEYDAWDKITGGQQLHVGKPSQTLLDLGVPNKEIRLSTDKLIEIAKDHSGMTDNVIKQIPSIIDDPIIVMKSRSVPESRITMFGELMDDNGDPVLAVLSTTPTVHGNDANAEYLALINAYGKERYDKKGREARQYFLDNSEMLYIDNERAQRWAASLGHELPSESALLSSSDASVAQKSTDVNTEAQNSIGGDITDADIDQMLSDAGLITMGQPNVPAPTNQLATQPQMPTQAPTGNWERQRQFGSQTAQRSDALHDEVKEYLRSHSGYMADSNQAQIDRAIGWVQDHATEQDTDGYFAAMDEVLSPEFNYMSADGQARMLTVLSMAAMKGDVASETRIADAYNQQGTDIGRTLQARNIFNMMTPLGRVSVLRRQESRLNQRYIDNGQSTRVHLSEETLRLAGEARTAEDFQVVQGRANQELAAQMPASWKEKLRAIRYFSMLFNPVTHIRNMVGNAGFMPAVAAKNVIGTGLERVLAKNSEQTKAIHANRENRQFAEQDAVTMKDMLTGEAKYNEIDPVEQERKYFGKGFQALIDFNSNLLEAEDWMFLRRHYANALSGWMQANNVTPAALQSDQAMLNRARAYAIEEAQKATYRDASKFSSMMSNISRQGGVAGFLVDAALPFKKTPTNILKRGLEYSPVGLLKTIVADTHKLNIYNNWVQNGQEGTMPSKAITPTQYIDRISSGLSGTAISALGALMSAMGWLRLGSDGDDDEIAKQNGEQDYSLRLKLFGQDVSYTIDWLAPACMPLFVGASIYNEAIKERNNEDALDVAADVTDSFLRISEPVFNLSMLDGVNSLLQTSSWGDAGNNITDIGATLLSNYATSFTPTVLGKVAKTIDTTRRETFVESGTSKTKGLIERTWQKTLAKVPGATYLLKPYVSPLGEEEKSSTVAAALQNFLSPGYFKNVEISDLEQEMQRVYEATGESGVIPKQPTKYYTVGGEKITMDADEYTAYQKARGATAKSLLATLVNSPEYRMYGDDAKVKMISDAWTYSTEIAKAQITPGYTMTKWVAEAQKDPMKALVTRREKAAQDDYINDHKTGLLKAVEEEDVDSVQANVTALRNAGKEMSSIRTYVSNVYRPQYKEAVESGDMDTAYDIQMLLMGIGLGYKISTFADWKKSKD